MKQPTTKEIKAARQEAGHTQTQAAAVIYKSMRGWQDWESGARPMDPALYELYLIKTGQDLRKRAHP